MIVMIIETEFVPRTNHWRYEWSLDRKSVVSGKSVDLGGRRIIKKKNKIRVVKIYNNAAG